MPLMQPEQSALTHRFVTRIRIGVIVRRERVAFMMIQTIAISRDARHENVPVQPRSGAKHRRAFHLGGCGATLPVIHVVEDGVELPARESHAQRFRFVAVTDDLVHAFAQVMSRFPVQNGDVVAGSGQLMHEQPAYEQGAADYKDMHRGEGENSRLWGSVMASGSLSGCVAR